MNQSNPLQQLKDQFPKPLQNKYVLVLICFLILLVFFDKHDVFTQWKLKRSVDKLEHDKAYYEEQIKRAKEDKQNIESNKERFAREKYHMHKADEDVFVIQQNNND